MGKGMRERKWVCVCVHARERNGRKGEGFGGFVYDFASGVHFDAWFFPWFLMVLVVFEYWLM